jgi:CRP/FNR family cyclic AMP-dependent transcriptional regulator
MSQFQPPSDQEIQRFLSACTCKKVPPRTLLTRNGEQPHKLFYMIKGKAVVSLKNPDGREMILAYLNQGDFFGEMGLFDQETRSAIIQTKTMAEVAEIDYKSFQNIVSQHLSILYKISQQLAHRLRITNKKVGDLAFLDVAGRVSHTLLSLAQEPDAMTHPKGMQIKITRQEIGAIVGCSREMVGRVLKTLESQGLVEVKGKTMLVLGERPLISTSTLKPKANQTTSF